MKKIFEWSVGSFFRTIGKFIAFILIGGLFAILFSKSGLRITDLLGITRVSALTGSYTSAKYGYRSITCSVQGDNCVYDVLSYFRNINTRIDNGDKAVGSIFFRAYNTNKFKSGNTYKLTYTVCENQKWDDYDTFERLTLQSVIGRYEYNTSATADNATVGNLSDVTLQIRDNPNSNQCWFADLSFNAYTDLQYVGFDVLLARFPIDMTTGQNFGFYTGGWFNVTNLNVTYEEGIGSAVANSANQIINNAQNNTNNIINNQNQNTQDIINNQNELLGNKCSNIYQSRLPSTTSCGITVTPNTDGSYTINGTSTCGIDFRLDQTTINGATNLFNLPKGTYTLSSGNLPNGLSLNVMQQNTWTSYFYNNSSTSTNTNTLNSNVNDLFIYVYVDNNTTINNYTIKPMLTPGTNSKTYCKYGSTLSKLDDVSNSINDLNDTINDDDTSSASNQASNFFSNFNTNNHGLTGIITAPLSAIQNLTSSTCRPLVIPIPFVNQNLTLPCMRDIYVTYFGQFMTLYDTITLGIISYWVMVRVFALVKDFKNPDHDEIEVLDL